MANSFLVDLIKQGSTTWNKWRNEQATLSSNVLGEIDLSRADLTGLDLKDAQLCGVNLYGANLSNSDLQWAELSFANLGGVNFLGSDLSYASLQDSNLSHSRMEKTIMNSARADRANLEWATILETSCKGIHLAGANLSNIFCVNVDMSYADLREANLKYANITGGILINAICIDADLTSAKLINANFQKSILYNAVCVNTDFTNAQFQQANLSGAELYGSTLRLSNCFQTDFSFANLAFADISVALFVEADVTECVLEANHIYGISAWGMHGVPAKQSDLIISTLGEPKITVSDLSAGQFIHSLLVNRQIRDIIDTITSKAVLILGRFTVERKAVLKALQDSLKAKNYLPIVFDFQGPSNRDITETISTLAHLSKFVIADITDARSIPQELQAIVPNLPSVPVLPILLASQSEYGMFEHFKRYPWVIDTLYYTSLKELIASIDKQVIEPLEARIRKQTRQ